MKDLLAHLYFKAKESFAQQAPPEVRGWCLLGPAWWLDCMLARDLKGCLPCMCMIPANGLGFQLATVKHLVPIERSMR